MKKLILLTLLVLLLVVGCSDEEAAENGAETEEAETDGMTMREEAAYNLENGVYEWSSYSDEDASAYVYDYILGNNPLNNELQARYSGTVIDEWEVYLKQFWYNELSDDGLLASFERVTGEEMPDIIRDALVEGEAVSLYLDTP